MDPNFLCLKLENDFRLSLLDFINQLRKSSNKSDGKIFHSAEDKSVDVAANSIVEGEMVGISGSSVYGTDQEEYGNIIYDTVADLIEVYVKKYYKESKSYKYFPTDCWYVVMKSGDFHKLHAHNNPYSHNSIGQLSGSIYLDIPENLPYPQGAIEWVFTGATDNLSNSSCEFSPKSGDVVLWPSWLRHHVYPFRGNKERIMISFNGIWGEHMNVKHIKEGLKEIE